MKWKRITKHGSGDWRVEDRPERNAQFILESMRKMHPESIAVETDRFFVIERPQGIYMVYTVYVREDMLR